MQPSYEARVTQTCGEAGWGYIPFYLCSASPHFGDLGRLWCSRQQLSYLCGEQNIPLQLLGCKVAFGLSVDITVGCVTRRRRN